MAQIIPVDFVRKQAIRFDGGQIGHTQAVIFNLEKMLAKTTAEKDVLLRKAKEVRNCYDVIEGNESLIRMELDRMYRVLDAALNEVRK